MPLHSDFLLKSQEFLFGKREVKLKDFFNINNFVELPITFARALLEFNSILIMIIEELSEVVKDESCLLLEYV